MSNTITNEQLVAESGLYTFFLAQSEDDKYDAFNAYWVSVIGMVAHKKWGWIDNITDLGYEKVIEAYNELVGLGFFEDDSEIF